MTHIVLDSSAVLAMVFDEPGGRRVRAAIVSPRHTVSISAVNWSEILVKLSQKSLVMTPAKLAALLPRVQVAPFGLPEAEQAAGLAATCPQISLGDRACLALAAFIGATAWTTDKIWAKLQVGATIEMIR